MGPVDHYLEYFIQHYYCTHLCYFLESKSPDEAEILSLLKALLISNDKNLENIASEYLKKRVSVQNAATYHQLAHHTRLKKL